MPSIILFHLPYSNTRHSPTLPVNTSTFKRVLCLFIHIPFNYLSYLTYSYMYYVCRCIVSYGV